MWPTNHPHDGSNEQARSDPGGEQEEHRLFDAGQGKEDVVNDERDNEQTNGTEGKPAGSRPL